MTKFINKKRRKTMGKEVLRPEESLLLISKTIQDAKKRFEANGHILVFWGTLTIIIFGSQLILSLLELYKYTMYPVYLFPLGTIYMIYVWIKEKKKNLPKTIIGNLLGTMGWVIGMNLMIMGFLFTNKLGEATAPVFLILMAMFIIVAGISIKFKPLAIGGVLLNLIGLGTFFFDIDYHGFSMMLGMVVGLIIPGLLLNNARRKDHV
jgi:hypothetical protein